LTAPFEHEHVPSLCAVPSLQLIHPLRDEFGTELPVQVWQTLGLAVNVRPEQEDTHPE
jgi:hypothetical protein